MNAVTDNSLGRPLKALALLLHYPDAELLENLDDITGVLHARPELLPADHAVLEDLTAAWREKDLYELQAQYVETFDRSKKVSLYLFEHVHGESRDRGPAMVELSNAYKENGLAVDGRELPDYLPMFLEFCSRLPESDARTWLDDTGHILQQVHVRLVSRESHHALPFRLLLRLLQLETEPEELVEEANSEQRDDTPAALDRVWMEAPVTFGPDEPRTSCGATKQWVEMPVQWKTPPLKDRHRQT